MEKSPGLFPMRLCHIDESDVGDEICNSMAEVGLELEFYDELSPFRVHARATDGSWLRVVTYALEVVLCRRVDRPVDQEDLTLSLCRSEEGRDGVAELCQGEIHRIVWRDGQVEPNHPLRHAPPVRLLDGEPGTLEAFFYKWIKGRARSG